MGPADVSIYFRSTLFFYFFFTYVDVLLTLADRVTAFCRTNGGRDGNKRIEFLAA